MNSLNGERFLKEAMDSVYAQTFTDWEIIFFDSGSTDKSVEIASGYDSKVKIFRLEKPMPFGQARQEAIDKATGEFLAFLDQDDVWLPFKLQIQYDVMKSGEYDMCYGGIQCIDERGKLLHKVMPVHSSGPMFEKQLWQFEANILTFVINRMKMLQSKVQFNPNLRVSPDDDFILVYLLVHDGCEVIHHVLANYRTHKNSATQTLTSNLAMERFSTLERLVREKPGIKELYPTTFKAAEARGYYYKARYLFDQKKYKEAVISMHVAVKLDKKYRLLYILCHLPLVWKSIHRFKGFLTPFWMKYIFLSPDKAKPSDKKEVDKSGE